MIVKITYVLTSVPDSLFSSSASASSLSLVIEFSLIVPSEEIQISTAHISLTLAFFSFPSLFFFSYASDAYKIIFDFYNNTFHKTMILY